MKDLWPKIKMPIAAVVLIILAFFVYTKFFASGGSSSNLSSDAQSASSTQSTTPEEQQFLALLLKIQRITINHSIFNDPVFLSLQDDSLPIGDQPQGRINPFAPIGSEDSISGVVGPSQNAPTNNATNITTGNTTTTTNTPASTSTKPIKK